MSATKTLFIPSITANLSRAAHGTLPSTALATGLRSTSTLLRPASRQFSTSHKSQLEFFPPPKNAPNIKLTPPTWPHYPSTEEQLKSIEVGHRETKTWSDYVAYKLVRFFRWSTNTVLRYKHSPNGPYTMDERKWLVRFIFLETVAGVPGMVGGMLRHFRSLRSMKRDNGWIETLLEDAYNERMHLLTFLKMAEPGLFMKLMILGAQGVFCNGFFISYLIWPKVCHRFVGYLEEEATSTYTLAIQDLEAGKLPKWENLEAPEIAVRYWNMPEGKRDMRHLLYYIRADEAKHREIHHTLANLDQGDDPNPFVSEYKDNSKPHPTRGIANIRTTGWEREDIMESPK